MNDQKATPEEITKALEAQTVSLRQALGVAADIMAAYIGSIKPSEGQSLTYEHMKKLHQLSVTILLHDICNKTKHPLEMADMLESIAADLRGETDEHACPGHVASAADPKVCAHCGVHIDELRQ